MSSSVAESSPPVSFRTPLRPCAYPEGRKLCRGLAPQNHHAYRLHEAFAVDEQTTCDTLVTLLYLVVFRVLGGW